jgi:calpastatin
MKGITDIERFVEAQESPYTGYTQALKEIKTGRKVSHWIWYIFPQLCGLGHSRLSHFYGISDRAEAKAYLNHPILGSRLKEISEALLTHTDKSAEWIFGSIDALKVKSCMTLFDCIAPNDIFSDVLDSFYNGERDKNSLV